MKKNKKYIKNFLKTYIPCDYSNSLKLMRWDMANMLKYLEGEEIFVGQEKTMRRIKIFICLIDRELKDCYTWDDRVNKFIDWRNGKESIELQNKLSEQNWEMLCEWQRKYMRKFWV